MRQQKLVNKFIAVSLNTPKGDGSAGFIMRKIDDMRLMENMTSHTFAKDVQSLAAT